MMGKVTARNQLPQRSASSKRRPASAEPRKIQGDASALWLKAGRRRKLWGCVKIKGCQSSTEWQLGCWIDAKIWDGFRCSFGANPQTNPWLMRSLEWIGDLKVQFLVIQIRFWDMVPCFYLR